MKLNRYDRQLIRDFEYRLFLEFRIHIDNSKNVNITLSGDNDLDNLQKTVHLIRAGNDTRINRLLDQDLENFYASNGKRLADCIFLMINNVDLALMIMLELGFNNKHMVSGFSKLLAVGDICAVMQMLKHFPDLCTYRLVSGLTPLMYALMYDKSVMADLLVNYELNPFLSNDENQNLLHMAAIKENEHVAIAIVDSGVDLNLLNRCDKNGKTPLDYAFEIHAMALLDVFLKNNMGRIHTWEMYFCSALSARATDICQAIIESSMDIANHIVGGKTLLYEAIVLGNHKVVNLLLRCSNVIYVLDSIYSGPLLSFKGCSLLAAVVKSNNLEGASLLLEMGANLIEVDANGLSILNLAIKNNNLEMFRAILLSAKNTKWLRELSSLVCHDKAHFGNVFQVSNQKYLRNFQMILIEAGGLNEEEVSMALTESICRYDFEMTVAIFSIYHNAISCLDKKAYDFIRAQVLIDLCKNKFNYIKWVPKYFPGIYTLKVDEFDDSILVHVGSKFGVRASQELIHHHHEQLDLVNDLKEAVNSAFLLYQNNRRKVSGRRCFCFNFSHHWLEEGQFSVLVETLSMCHKYSECCQLLYAFLKRNVNSCSDHSPSTLVAKELAKISSSVDRNISNKDLVKECINKLENEMYCSTSELHLVHNNVLKTSEGCSSVMKP